MFGRMQIGVNANSLRSDIEKKLKDLPKELTDAAYTAASNEEDTNKKAVAAARVLISELLPNAIAYAINENNRVFVDVVEKIYSDMRSLR